MPAKDITHLSRHSSIAGKIRREKDGIRTEAFGTNGGHRGTHAEFPRFVRRRADNGAVSPPRDNDGLAAQLRIVPLLDGSVECVHVDVHDFAHRYVWTILGVERTLGGTTAEQVAVVAWATTALAKPMATNSLRDWSFGSGRNTTSAGRVSGPGRLLISRDLGRLRLSMAGHRPFRVAHKTYLLSRKCLLVCDAAQNGYRLSWNRTCNPNAKEGAERSYAHRQDEEARNSPAPRRESGSSRP